MTGFLTLLYKELLRFWKVGFQTVFAPMVSTLLYLMIFSHVLEAHVEAFPGVAYTTFLIPGLVMMAVLQNAFANSSSSLIQSKITGNLVFVLLSPLSYREIFFAYVLASVVRGLAVGLGVYLVTVGFFDVAVASFPWRLSHIASSSRSRASAYALTLSCTYSDTSRCKSPSLTHVPR